MRLAVGPAPCRATKSSSPTPSGSARHAARTRCLQRPGDAATRAERAARGHRADEMREPVGAGVLRRLRERVARARHPDPDTADCSPRSCSATRLDCPAASPIVHADRDAPSARPLRTARRAARHADRRPPRPRDGGDRDVALRALARRSVGARGAAGAPRSGSSLSALAPGEPRRARAACAALAPRLPAPAGPGPGSPDWRS